MPLFQHLRPVILLIVFLAALSPIRGSQDAVRPTTEAALDLYGRGHFEAAIDQLMSDSNLAASMRRFRSDAAEWMAGGPPSETASREALVATVVLDLAGRGVHRGPDGGIPFPLYLDALRPLLEWMCARLRDGPPVPIERVYHLGATALLQATHSLDLLVATRWAGSSIVPQAHILHGAERFPEESRFKLAWVLMRYETLLIASGPLAPGYLLNRASGRFEADGGAARNLNDTIAVLTKLADDPGVGEEARLRRGVLRFLMDEPTVATTDLQPLTASSDTFVRYIAHMILGAIHSRADEWPAAERQYRAAFTTVGASSAGTMLATSLFRLGRTADAAEILEQSEGLPPDTDPWRQYGMRDYRLFPTYLVQMRAMVVREP